MPRPRPQWTWKLVFLPVQFVLLQASGCGDDSPNPLAEGEEVRATIELRETALEEGECIHLFAPGEDFPCCRICRTGAVGGARTVSMDVTRGSSLVFRAGRNGEILDEQSCRVSTASGSLFAVEWIGAGLDCGLGFD
jgi:hypothetical protein